MFREGGGEGYTRGKKEIKVYFRLRLPGLFSGALYTWGGLIFGVLR